jgi:hypothetical protein
MKNVKIGALFLQPNDSQFRYSNQSRNGKQSFRILFIFNTRNGPVEHYHRLASVINSEAMLLCYPRYLCILSFEHTITV